MLIQKTQKNNYNASFGKILKVDKNLISRASTKEKEYLAYLKNQYKYCGDNSTIDVKNDKNKSIKEIMLYLHKNLISLRTKQEESKKFIDSFGNSVKI